MARPLLPLAPSRLLCRWRSVLGGYRMGAAVMSVFTVAPDYLSPDAEERRIEALVIRIAEHGIRGGVNEEGFACCESVPDWLLQRVQDYRAGRLWFERRAA